MTRQLYSGGHVFSHNYGDSRVGSGRDWLCMRAGRGEAVRMGRRGVQRQSRACAQAGPLSPRASQCGLFDWQSHAVSWDSGLPQQCSRLASCRTRMPSFLSLQSLSIPVWGSDDARLSRHQHAHSSTLWQMSGCVPFPFMMLSRDSRMMIITTRQFHSRIFLHPMPLLCTLCSQGQVH